MTTNSVLVQNPNPMDHVLLGVEEIDDQAEARMTLDRVKQTTLYIMGVDIIADMVEFTIMASPLYLVMIFFTLWGTAGVQNENKYIIKIYLTYITILICLKIIILYTTLYVVILLGTIMDILCLIMVLKTFNKLV